MWELKLQAFFFFLLENSDNEFEPETSKSIWSPLRLRFFTCVCSI
ncbi:unnamed protein product, partial [Ixodes persulcatus]